jgi:DNA primase
MDNLEKRDIVEIVCEFVDLEEKGDEDRPYLVGLCPFHDEKNPSFIVYPKIQRCYCYACWPDGGDVIDFVRRKLDIGFQEAVKICCNELTEEEAFQRFVKNQIVDNEVDHKILNIRMRKVLFSLDLMEANQVFFRLDKLIESGRWVEADSLLRRYGV